jgi:hypothetical protein
MGESSAPTGLRTTFAVPIFVPLDKGDAALFCGRGSRISPLKTPYGPPFSRGTKIGEQPKTLRLLSVKEKSVIDSSGVRKTTDQS